MLDNGRVIQTQSAGNENQKLRHPQPCSAASSFESLSGPAGRVEEIRQRKAIAYSLEHKAKKGLISSTADPKGLKS